MSRPRLRWLHAAFPDEASAVEFLTAVRWRKGAYCPHCRSRRVYHFADGRTHKCAACAKRFTIKVGTIFDRSKIGIRAWLMAIRLITTCRTPVTSVALAQDVGVTQKTAWFILRRLRAAARAASVQAGAQDPAPCGRGLSTEDKLALLRILERGGEPL